MAKNDNLKDFVTDVADAIREKKGTTDLINPQDFSAEIKSIEGGGGSGEGEGSTIEYLDVSEVSGDTMVYLSWFGLAASGNVISMPGGNATPVCGMPMYYYQQSKPEGEFPKYIAIDVQWKMKMQGQEVTTGEMLLTMLGDKYSNLPRITKEQFYSLG